MSNFTFSPTDIPGVQIVDVKSFGDARGYFMETYRAADFAAAGITDAFVQDNQSCSHRGVLRGLHFQKRHQQAKLVRAISGEIFDVAVDLRRGSATYGRWVGVVLSAENRRQLYIPRGFAHGFQVLSEQAVFAYKCGDVYHPEDEAVCAMTMRTSASSGRDGTRPSSAKRIRTGRRCARSASSCDAASAAEVRS